MPILPIQNIIVKYLRLPFPSVIVRSGSPEAISISTKNNIVGATLVVAQNNKRGRVKPCPYIYGETATLTMFARGDKEGVIARGFSPEAISKDETATLTAFTHGDKKSHFSVADKNYTHLNFTVSTHSVSSL